MAQTERIERITTLNFLFTCVIVMYHCSCFPNTTSSLDALLTEKITFVTNYLVIGSMCFFFFVSAFLLFNNLTYKSVPGKIKKRFFTLLFPYLIWQGLSLIVYFASGRYYLPMEIIEKTFLFKRFPLDGPLWYLYSIFLLSMLSPVFLLLFRNKKAGFVILLILCYVTCFIAQNDKVTTLIKDRVLINVLSYMPAYLAGAYAGIHFPKLKEKDFIISVLLFLSISAVITIVFNRKFIIYALRASFPAVLLFIYPERAAFKWKVFDLSFLMYAIHYPLFIVSSDFMLDILNKTGFYCSVLTILSRVFYLAVTIGISWGINALPLPNIKKMITGGR